MHYNFDEIINREGTSSYKYDLRGKIFDNKNVIPMWVADMDFKTPDFIINAIQKRLEHEIFGYTYIPASFYDAVVKWNQRHHNWNINKEWITFSPGIVPALNLLVMAYTKPGDGVMIQSPVYFPFFSAVENHGRKLITNPLCYKNGTYSIDLEDLEAKIDDRTRMLILCSPHNPVGIVWPPQVLKSLGEICVKNNMVLVSDEIHCDLVYDGYKHIPTACLSDEIARISVTCMSPSKTFNMAGLSTAYLVIPDRGMRWQYEDTRDRIHVDSGNIFGFVAAEAAYSSGDDWLRQLMEYLTGNVRLIQEFMARHIPRIKVIPPQATYLVWLDCKDLGLSSDDLRSFMISKAGLGLNNGIQFGEGGEGFQRINIACPRQILLKALLKLQKAVDEIL